MTRVSTPPVVTFPNLSLSGDFVDEFASDDGRVSATGFRPSEAQTLVRRFLEASPYRGLLLYHKLGAGKTCAAIGIAEAVDPSRYPRIIVVLAAALQPNFRSETRKCGDARHAHRYEFVHFNGLTLDKVRGMQASDPPFFDNAVIVVDEVHNITKSVVNMESRVNVALYDMIASARNSKVVAMSGTPMVNTAAEIAFVITLVRGFTLRHVLHFPWMGDLDLVRIDEYLSEQHPCVVRHGFDVRSKDIWVEMLPNGYRFVDARTKTRICERAPADFDNADLLSRLGPDRMKTVRIAPMTLDAGRFFEEYVDANTGVCREDMREDFMRRVRGFVSFYQPSVRGLYPHLRATLTVMCPMSDMQFNAYTIARSKEIELDKQNARDRNSPDSDSSGDSDASSVYRTYSRRLCNFCFPDGLSTDWFTSRRKLEEDRDHVRRANKLLKVLRGRPEYVTFDDKLAETSPKYRALLDRVGALANGCSLIYSSFRNVPEGLPALAAVLEGNGFEPFDITVTDRRSGGVVKVTRITPGKRRYMLFDASKKRPSPQQMINIFNGDLDGVDADVVDALSEAAGQVGVANTRGELVSVIMISESGSEGISLKNVRHVHVMEPYWQRVRIQQVVGRAVRAYSHHALPEDERTVEAFLYVSTMSDEQKDRVPFAVKRNDRGVTTDEHLLQLSVRKANTIDSFTELLKRAAIDCKVLQRSRQDCFS